MKNLQVEYIVILTTNSSFCKSTKTFNLLLTANDDIELKGARLRHKAMEVDYQIRVSELADKKLRFFHLKFSCSQINRIDEFAELLKVVRTAAYKTDGQVKTLRDDVSFYYSNESYPLINEIENLMRRLIFQFLLTTVGDNWEKDALPKDLKDGLKKKKGGENSPTNILHETDFIQLADCLFKPFSTKEIDDLYKQLENAQLLSDLNLDNLKEFVPKSNWARYFSSLVDCEDTFLNKRWTELYDSRCLVAHNNLVQKNDYDKIVALVSEVKPKLEKAIGNLSKVRVPEQERDNLAENIVANLGNPKIKFTSYFIRIVGYLWNDEQLRDVTAADLLKDLGPGAYGNYNKLRIKPWSLIEDSEKAGDKRTFRLSEKGKSFVQGLLTIPEEVSRSTPSAEWEASPSCRYISINDVYA